MKIWAVRYGNYFPEEIDSLWFTEEQARVRARELGGMWEVSEMIIQGEVDNASTKL